MGFGGWGFVDFCGLDFRAAGRLIAELAQSLHRVLAVVCDVDLNVGTRASQANDNAIFRDRLGYPFTVQVGAVGAEIHNFPTGVSLPQFHMVSRHHRTIQHDLVLSRAPNSNDRIFFESPMLDRLFI